MPFEEESYKRHASQYAEKDQKLVESWLDKETVDYWRHERMYSMLTPLLQSDPGARWVTVGDGRYGTDANYINTHGGQAVATDIADYCLQQAYEMGFITAYSRENAEALSFEDNSFDYALCKEAYHHFPRPMVALYELIRVAKKGVLLIEPNDRNQIMPHRLSFSDVLYTLAKTAKRFMGWLKGKDVYNYGQYEEVGNYIYSISQREIEKVGLGLNLPMVAFRRLFDYWEPAVSEEKVAQNGPVLAKVKRMIKRQELQNKLGLIRNGHLVTIIFKETPNEKTQQALKAAGYTLYNLPDNPYNSRKR